MRKLAYSFETFFHSPIESNLVCDFVYRTLKRAQEIDNVLLFSNWQLFEMFDDSVGLTAFAPVSADSLN